MPIVSVPDVSVSSVSGVQSASETVDGARRVGRTCRRSRRRRRSRTAAPTRQSSSRDLRMRDWDTIDLLGLRRGRGTRGILPRARLPPCPTARTASFADGDRASRRSAPAATGATITRDWFGPPGSQRRLHRRADPAGDPRRDRRRGAAAALADAPLPAPAGRGRGRDRGHGRALGRLGDHLLGPDRPGRPDDDARALRAQLRLRAGDELGPGAPGGAAARGGRAAARSREETPPIFRAARDAAGLRLAAVQRRRGGDRRRLAARPRRRSI